MIMKYILSLSLGWQMRIIEGTLQKKDDDYNLICRLTGKVVCYKILNWLHRFSGVML